MIIGVSTNGKVFIHTGFREEIRHVLFTLKKWNRKWQMRTILKTLILLVVTWPQRRVLMSLSINGVFSVAKATLHSQMSIRPFVRLLVTETPQQLEIIILHHSSFSLPSFRDF